MPRQAKGEGTEQLVRAAEEYVLAHSREKFSLQAMADALYVNKSYLLRLFKAHTGSTLLSFHNQTRCEQAKRLLRESELSISQVGEAVGFVSSSHFSFVFRKTVGVTPTEYRAQGGESAPSEISQ